LQKTPIKQSKHIPPFPLTPLFLRSKNPHLINPHHPKLYPKPQLPPPPISLPHLHTTFLNRQPSLLFPPFAAFSPKFLKTASYLD
ncbi:malate:quinone oxidoreductase, partial [Staphylococcus warneri]|uniref:malate:quinone oxidoreductase n=1 Tax=Staphylococcus warneri TaxID=1292 RepID=UPI00119E5105